MELLICTYTRVAMLTIINRDSHIMRQKKLNFLATKIFSTSAFFSVQNLTLQQNYLLIQSKGKSGRAILILGQASGVASPVFERG